MRSTCGHSRPLDCLRSLADEVEIATSRRSRLGGYEVFQAPIAYGAERGWLTLVTSGMGKRVVDAARVAERLGE